MALSAPVLALLAGLGFALLHSGEGLHCWVCSSDADPTCGDPFNTTKKYLLTDCDRDKSHTTYLKSPAVCRKYKHKVSKNSEEEIVVRSCAWGSADEGEGPCSQSSLHFLQYLESCNVCNTDECNAASGLQTLSLLLALPAAAFAARLL